MAESSLRPTQRCWRPPAVQKVFERIRLVDPAPARAAGQGGDVDQASHDPEAEAVYDVVGIFYFAAGSGHEEAAGLPHAVPVDGEGLARPVLLLRPAEDASGVARRLEAIAAQLLVHEILVGLGRGTWNEPEGDACLGAPSRRGPQVERAAGVGTLYLEPGLPAEHRRVLQPGEETLGEPSGLRLGLADSPERAIGLLPVANQALEGALLETHPPSLSPRNAAHGRRDREIA